MSDVPEIPHNIWLPKTVMSVMDIAAATYIVGSNMKKSASYKSHTFLLWGHFVRKKS